MKMTSKEREQWFFETDWGKLAMVSWGQSTDPPVLLVHGYMDSAATFIPLVQKLPDTYYYVAVDLPGHGLSDPYPAGILPSQIHLVEVIRIVVNRMNWKKFVFMGHSMGVLLGIFYYAVYPNQISKMISLDPLPPISMYYLTNKLNVWYAALYSAYYGNYPRYTLNKPRLYTYDQAINAVVRSRNITEEQAEGVLSRALIPVRDGKYRLSWDSKMKIITNVTMSKEMLFQIITMNAPPTLTVCATEDSSVEPGRKWGRELMRKVQDTTPNYLTVFVKGGHDIHITNAEEVASHIVEFLNREFNVSSKCIKCKL